MTLTFRQLFVLLFISFAVFLAASVLQAWTGPTATAPNGNVAAPINVGTTDQVKDGGLSLDALAVFGSSYIQEKLGIGRTSPVVALDVNGSVRIANGGEVCQAVTAGTQRYNTTTKKIEFCDGTSWQAVGGGTDLSNCTLQYRFEFGGVDPWQSIPLDGSSATGDWSAHAIGNAGDQCRTGKCGIQMQIVCGS
jgi:hypothetical protein